MDEDRVMDMKRQGATKNVEKEGQERKRKKKKSVKEGKGRRK